MPPGRPQNRPQGKPPDSPSCYDLSQQSDRFSGQGIQWVDWTEKPFDPYDLNSIAQYNQKHRQRRP